MEQDTQLRELFNSISEFKGIGREAKLVRPVVDIETWLNEEFYSGPAAYQIYPYWKRAIIEVFSSPVRVNEVILGGSIGTGKTTIATYMIAYRLYESCYYPPQALYNLMNNSKILFAYFNINKEVAGQVGFSQIRDLIDTIPYFQNIFKRNERKNSLLEWPQCHIYMKSASSSNDVIGMNLISFFVDEANFFKGDGAKGGTSINDVQSKAKQLYNSVRTRGKSRFVVNNEDYTFNILVSSSMYDSSFTAERIQESQGDPHVKVYEPKIWEVKNVDTYSKEKFVVFSGNELIDPMICKSVADINYIRTHYRLPEVKCDTPNEAIKDIVDYDIKKRLIEVPMNFLHEFEGNIIQALQDIAGVPVSATGKLFSNRECYSKALELSEESPFIQDQIVISTAASTTIQDYFRQGWKPKSPGKKRFLHFDQSTSGDSYGVAQCYIDEVIYDDFGLPLVKIKYDWMIRINPPKPPHKIDLAKVRSIIPWQEKVFGISYGMISYDTFQSAEAVQDLEKSGYPVQYRSVEKDKPYLDLCDLYYQGRIKHYRNEWYEKELFDLVWLRAAGKVDHPPVKDGGTKDLADSVCGAAANALEYPAVEEMQRENDINYFVNDDHIDRSYVNDRDDLMSGFEQSLRYNRY